MDNNFKSQRSSRVILGLIIALAGVLLLLQSLNILYFPGYLISWPMLLIVIGLLAGIKSRFRNVGPFIILFVGLFFLLRNYLGLPDEVRHAFWPALLVFFGLFMALRPNKSKHCGTTRHHWGEHRYEGGSGSGGYNPESYMEKESSDRLDTTAIFSGSQRNVISKDFKGGQITAIMGGVDLNFSQTDFTGKIYLDLTVVMGGVNLVLPPHWKLDVQTTMIAGGIEDKRMVMGPQDDSKELVLTGVIVMGGIEIKSI